MHFTSKIGAFARPAAGVRRADGTPIAEGDSQAILAIAGIVLQKNAEKYPNSYCKAKGTP